MKCLTLLVSLLTVSVQTASAEQVDEFAVRAALMKFIDSDLPTKRGKATLRSLAWYLDVEDHDFERVSGDDLRERLKKRNRRDSNFIWGKEGALRKSSGYLIIANFDNYVCGIRFYLSEENYEVLAIIGYCD